jgi:hypothetical protein
VINAFAVQVHPYERQATIINHLQDGSQVVLDYPYGDLADMAALLLQAKQMIEANIREEMAEAEAEAEQLAEAEGGGVRQRETALEMDYDRQGHDRF